MRAKLRGTLLLVGILSIVSLLHEAEAQNPPAYLQLSRTVKAALYSPADASAARVGVVNMHEDGNRLADITCTELSKRGFYVLCMNGRSDNNEAADFWNDLPMDVATGVRYLKETVKVSRVILYGGSGGGPLMTFYQNVAQNGPSVCQGPNKLIPCSSELAGLPPADGIILRDAHPGTAVNTLRSINPALLRDDKPDQISPALDPFNPKNGFNPSGSSNYSQEFKERYFKAQAARMNRLVDQALTKLHAMDGGKYYYNDDDVFLVHGSEVGRLAELDLSIGNATLKPQKLLKNNGTMVTEIVRSVRKPNLDLVKRAKSFQDGSKLLTVKSFLGTRAIRARDSMTDIDFCSNNNSTPCHLQKITAPILILGMGGYIFLRDNEIHYEVSASPDKEYVIIEGAAHGIVPCKSCESFPGQYSNTVKNAFDYMQKWINTRFRS
ncbi:MAG TPA: hypothetical protein VLX11_06400 [Candidatus Acidoferrales bacterium]|nr:hypothetical protein [Candidatus Acidoferrales bacterium]